MPFRAFEWDGDQVKLGASTPAPEPVLRQVDTREFVLENSFCFQGADEATVWVIPGEDDATDAAERRDTTATTGETVAVPPTRHRGRTDLASVPWFMWWLIASYGNHTRAALLHDALYADGGLGEVPPVPRAEADRLFLAALREPEQEKPGVFRHWLMWAAVSLFGNMGPLRGIVCALHVLAVWVLTLGAVSHEWGSTVWDVVSWPWWVKVPVGAAVLALAAGIALGVLGGSWRAGVDITGGWLAPTLVLTAIVLVLLLRIGTWPLWLALVLMVLGPLWGLYVAKPLRWWLWPTSVIGLPISLLPIALIFAAVFLVWCIDVGAMLAKWLWRDGPLDLPSVTPSRLPL